MIFGGVYDTSKSRLFYEDNVNIGFDIEEFSSDNVCFTFFWSKAPPGDK